MNTELQFPIKTYGEIVTKPIATIIDPAILSVKDPILRNLHVALEIAKAAPVEKFNLAFFTNETGCGTLFCLAGTISLYDYFQKQGMWIEKSECITHFVTAEDVAPLDENGDKREGAMAALFGKDAYDRLFSTYGGGTHDRMLIADHGLPLSKGTSHLGYQHHKDLAIARLEYAIAQREAELSNGG
jgi:hypothetical protein